MSSHQIDPRTPVIVGVGQSSERIDALSYRALSPVELGANALRAALVDTGAVVSDVADAIDTVAGVRQFENSWPGAIAPFGRSDNYPRSVGEGAGLTPRRALLEVGGGQSPQHLINEFAALIARGHSVAVAIFGSEAMSTARHLANADERPNWEEHVDGDLEDRGFGLDGLVSDELMKYRLAGAIGQYALFENARRARRGESRGDYATAMGRLFSPFSEVAAANPHAAAPLVRSVEELATVTERNRALSDPYSRYLVARDQVNQGAAVVMMSVEAARRAGVAENRWVYLHGHSDLRERTFFEREDLSTSPAAVMATQHALDVAQISLEDVTTFDLYSCFPIAVFNICDGLRLAPDDPRGLTVTGGLPFFGGPGNDYSMHAVAEIIPRLRAVPGSYGFVGANGGMLSKYSTGVYSTTPTPWRDDDSAVLQREIDGWSAPQHVERADGPATIETFTVRDGRSAKRGVIVGRQRSDDRRFLALTGEGDEEMVALLSSENPVGQTVDVTSTPEGNVATRLR